MRVDVFAVIRASSAKAHELRWADDRTHDEQTRVRAGRFRVQRLEGMGNPGCEQHPIGDPEQCPQRHRFARSRARECDPPRHQGHDPDGGERRLLHRRREQHGAERGER